MFNDSTRAVDLIDCAIEIPHNGHVTSFVASDRSEAEKGNAMDTGWGPDEAPWARRAGASQPDRGTEGPGYLDCYFCGQKSVKRSYGDKADDNGRLELYCTSEYCEAREMTVIVLKDTIQAHHRADVRILAALDHDIDELTAITVDVLPLRTLQDVMREPEPPLTARRTNRDDVVAAARGWGQP